MLGHKRKTGARRCEARLKDFSVEKYFWSGEESARAILLFWRAFNSCSVFY